jgi:hypothetical protein
VVDLGGNRPAGTGLLRVLHTVEGGHLRRQRSM